MNKNQQIKEMVKHRYNELALEPLQGKCCCCAPKIPSKKVFTIMSEDYSKLKGYEPNADLGVGCGLPVQYAGIKSGDTVVDLGAGAGNDCFIAREEVGDKGHVIGIDFAPNMIARARANAQRRGYSNIEFIEADIENTTLKDASIDVVVSNCVLNLLPHKETIFREIYRILKPDGHFCVSDVVLNGHFPQSFLDNAALYAGCIASAIQESEYLSEISKAGFSDVVVARKKVVDIPEDVLTEHLTPEQILEYQKQDVGVYSITVVGYRR